jgi:hypothetical protein
VSSQWPDNRATRGRPGGGSPRELRPWFLVAAMFLAWFVGASGYSSGCATMTELQGGTVPDVAQVTEEAKAADDPVQGLVEVLHAARVVAWAEHRGRALPLAVARLVLSMLLIVTCAMAMAGRGSSRSYALQALAANALFAIADHVLSAPIREAWIASVVAAAAELPLTAPEHQMLHEPRFFDGLEAARLILFQLVALGAAALALFSSRTRAFCAAVAEAERGREEEEEEP